MPVRAQQFHGRSGIHSENGKSLLAVAALVTVCLLTHSGAVVLAAFAGLVVLGAGPLP